MQRYEGAAAPAEGVVHVRQGAEPPDFLAALQMPDSFALRPLTAYDADFEVRQLCVDTVSM